MKKVFNARKNETSKRTMISDTVSKRMSFNDFMFLGLTLGVIYLCANYLWQSKSFLISGIHLVVPFPSLSEINQNLMLMIHGYQNGYLRAIMGCVYFCMMASFFLATGHIIVEKVFRNENERNTFMEISFLERISLCYILGSLAGSLLWFGLGLAGILNFHVGFAIGIGGIVLFTWQFMRSQRLTDAQNEINFWRSGFSVTEKVLYFLLAAILLLFFTTSVMIPRQGDTLITHMALPNYFIQHGKVMINPYHFHSYFPSNTEMLILWAQLLKSEVAAALLIWGYLVAFVCLMLGFLKRYTNVLFALSTVLLFLSVPIIGHSAMTIKNDLAVALFIFAHYCVLAESFNRCSRRWMFLAGLLAGAAIGHKLVALPIIFFSSILVILVDFCRSRTGVKSFYLPLWIAGISVAVFPWVLRTYLATGNPIYPFLGKIFHSRIADPLYLDVENKFYFNTQGLNQLEDYFSSVVFGSGIAHMPELYGRVSWVSRNLPSWGPTLIFAVLAVSLALSSQFSLGIRLCAGACSLSFLFLLLSTEIRFHMGLLSFGIFVPFGLSAFHTLKSRLTVLSKFLTLFCLAISYYVIFPNMGSILINSFNNFVSGYSQGNYEFFEKAVGDLRWVTHVANTHSPKDGAFLYAGINYGYGLERKFYYSSGFDREMICELAKSSSDADMLREKIRLMGVKNILIGAQFFEQFKNHTAPPLRMDDRDLKKIEELLSMYMVLRFSTPDNTIRWYSFKDAIGPSIVFGRNDILDFPISFIEEARTRYSKGDVDGAVKMLEEVLKVPILPPNKAAARELLASIYQEQGGVAYTQKLYDRAEIFYKKAIEVDPQYYSAYNNLGVIYLNRGQFQESLQFYKKALEIKPDYDMAQHGLELVQIKLKSSK